MPTNALALAPFFVAGTALWREASWFESWSTSSALELIAFTAVVGVAVCLFCAVIYTRSRSFTSLAVLAVLLAALAGLVARQAVILFVHYNYSTEMQAYSSLVAVAASKRGLLFTVCAALCPMLLAAVFALRRWRETKQPLRSAAGEA